MAEGSLIETGIDKLIALVEERGRISLPKAAKELGVSRSVIEGWVKFLEEEDLVTIEYSLTVPYLVYKKLSKRDVLKKAKEFSSKKDAFISKATVTLGFLEKEGERLKKSKGEFDRLKKELGYEIDKVKDELAELEKYEQLKTGLDEKLNEQRKVMQESLKKYDEQLKAEQNKYQNLIGDIEAEEKKLLDEEKDSLALEEQEKKIYEKIAGLKESLEEVEKKVKGKEDVVAQYREHIKDLQGMAEEIKKGMESKGKSLQPLVDEAKEKEKEIEEMQDTILKKLSAHGREVRESKEVTDKFQQFFNQKLKIEELLTRINKDRDELEATLKAVLKKAQAFQLAGKEKDVAKNIVELEKMFGDVEKKKSFFEDELKKLKSFLGK